MRTYVTFTPPTCAARPFDERYWVAICLGGKIGDGEVRELLDSSYTAVVSRLPRRLRPPSQDWR